MIEVNIEERVQRARDNFRNGKNCSQAVVEAFADCFGGDATILSRLALPFGGGFGRQRQVCGAVSGAAMILSLMHTAEETQAQVESGAQHSLLNDHRKEVYQAVQDFCKDFSLVNGSYICGELLDLKPGENSQSTPEARNENYYKRRPCAEYVASSARIVAQKLIDYGYAVNAGSATTK